MGESNEYVFLLQKDLQIYKFTPAIGKSGAFIGAHEGPHSEFFDPLHEQIRDPKCVEEVAGSLLFFSVIFAEVEEGKDIGVPRLEVDGKSTGSFVSALKQNIEICTT